LKRLDIERYFQEVNRRIDFSIRVLLTGGAAALLYGAVRVTEDIDFEVHILKTHGERAAWPRLHQALREASRATGLVPQYAEDIDRWSSIVLPSKKSRLFQKIGKVEVRLLDPEIWAIGKLTRFLDSDLQDLLVVLQHASADPRNLARAWGRALGQSPRSSAQDQFRLHVEHFFDAYAKKLWGSRIQPEELKKLVLASAQTASRRR